MIGGGIWIPSVKWGSSPLDNWGNYADGRWGYWDAGMNFYGELVFGDTSSDEGIALTVLEPAGGTGVTIQPAVLDSRRIVTLPGTNYYGGVVWGADYTHAYVFIVDGANPPPTVKIKVTAMGKTGPESCTFTWVYHPAGPVVLRDGYGLPDDSKVERGR